MRCAYCSEDTDHLTKDPHWGFICNACCIEMDRVDKDTDWDTWEAEKRQRIAESSGR